MSAFPAGSIVGRLGLDVSEYAEGMRESTSIAGTFAAEIGHILAEATGSPVLGELANGISEVVAAAASNNIWETFAAAIHTGGAAVGGLIEVVKGQAEAMHEAGLAAEKYGASVEFISSVGKAAKVSGMDIDVLGMSMKFMLDRAANAVDGNKEALKAFAELGIRSDQLAKLMQNPEEMFYAVADGMSAIPYQAERIQAATDLMSRAGVNALPFLEQGSDKIKALAKDIADMGGSFTENDAQMGRSVGELSALFAAAMDGIKNAAARPILADLVSHMDEVKAGAKSFAEYLEPKVTGAIYEIQDAFKGMEQDLPPIVSGMESVSSAVLHVTAALVDLYAQVQEGSSSDHGWGEALGEWWGRITSDHLDKNHHLNGEMPAGYAYDPTGQTHWHPGYDPAHSGASPAHAGAPPIVINNNISPSSKDIAAAAAEATRKAVVKGLQQHAAKTNLHLQKQIESHL